VRLGAASQGKARLDCYDRIGSRRGLAGLGEARLGEAGQGKARQGKARIFWPFPKTPLARDFDVV